LEFQTETRIPAARATMETLYDLLGALPHDNADDLRTAFRRAVKGAHPDMRPGDPDAALKFREIVRASEILSDAEQRAVYDDLLKLANLERKSASRHPAAARIRKIASAVIALSWASVVTAGGYFLFMYMSAAPIASTISFETTAAPPPKSGRTIIASEPRVPPAALPENSSEAVLVSNADAAPDVAATEARSMPPDLKIRFADLDDALQPDARVLPAYADPGIIFYRVGTSEPAFPDTARAKRIEKPGRSKSVPTMSRKRPIVPAAIATPVTPVSQRRTIARGPSPGEAFASAIRWR
jgi:curved DNA-binding protein CbpA